MDDIAKKLDMKKASLYYHFSSKEDMFIKVLIHSFEKYKLFSLELLKSTDIKNIISSFISFPVEAKNLFSVVSQKWYCKIWILSDLIATKNNELLNEISVFFFDKYSFSKEKTIIFLWTINDLSKKYCIFDCKEQLDINKISSEIEKVFFLK